MNIKDLHEKFPMIKEIQSKMKSEKNEITIGQRKAFPRQVENSAILQLHVEMIQSLTVKLNRSRIRNKELQKELDRIESIFSDRTETIESLEAKIEFLKNRKV